MAWYGTTRAGVKAKNARHAKRRAEREKAAHVDGDIIDLDRVYAVHNGRCHLCKRRVARELAHFDHVIALASGGEHSEENLAPSHPKCNLEKGARDPGASKKKGLRRRAPLRRKPKPLPPAPGGEECF
ncbi:MAG TPA: HNH endonuclease signature motif containing protein [Polyangiaceae bacterium]|jgi:5-methylcytosine-specific restriction endonuclease McrA